MTDDIVTRLLNDWDYENCCTSCGIGKWRNGSHYPACLYADAADEIESLRSYIADLQAELCRLERENARHV